MGMCSALVLVTAPTEAATACPTPKQPVVTVSTQMPPPVIDNSLSPSAIQALTPKKRPGDEPIGLYSASVERTYDVSFTLQRLGSDICVTVERVPVVLSLTKRMIHVERDRRPGTCAYDQVLNHERRHQAVDEEVMRASVPKLLQRVQTAANRAGNREWAPAVRQTELLQQANALIAAALDEALQEVLTERARREAEVDTPPEFARVRALCP